MTINNIREMLASVPPPPPHSLTIPVVQQPPQNFNGTTHNKEKLTTKMPTFPPPPGNVPSRVFLHPPMPHQGGPVNQTQGQVPMVTMVPSPQPQQFTAPPPPHVAKQQNPVVPSNNMVPQYPRIWVPYMDDVALSQVDVNCPPSQENNGQDLPNNDVNTLRFFFNLGVEYYRYISNLSCAIAMQNGATGPVQPIVYCHSKPAGDVRAVDLNNAGNHSVLNVANNGKNKDATANFDLDDKSSASSDSGCETEIGNRCHGNRNDCCHENKNSESVKSDTCTVSYVADGVKNVEGRKTASVELSSIRQESAIDLQSNCSDMSVSDTVDGTISVASGQEQSTSRQMRPRRKYYMYGNLKLIKPIKDVPKRFLDLLNSINAEKHRVEGEPIILASPNHGEEQYQELTASYAFNPEAQCFVPGTTGVNIEGISGAKPDIGNTTSLHSPLPASSTAGYTMYVLHQPTLPHLSGNQSNIHLSNGTQITSSSHSNSQFPCTPLHTGYHSNQGPVYQ